MPKGELLLIQPINIIVEDETFNYGLLEGIYYPYMVARKTGEHTCKDILFGGEYILTDCEEKKFADIKQIKEIAFSPARKVMKIDEIPDNMSLVQLYMLNRGPVPNEKLQESSSVLRDYFNRVDYASGKEERLPMNIFEKVFKFSISDIYNANTCASNECEYKLEEIKHK